MLHKVITVQGLQSRRAREAEPRSDVECLHPSSPTSMSTGLVWWNLLLPFPVPVPHAAQGSGAAPLPKPDAVSDCWF